MHNNSKCLECQTWPCICSPLDSKELLFDQGGNQNYGASIAIMFTLLLPLLASLEDGVRVGESTVKHFGRLDVLLNAAAGSFLFALEDLAPDGFGIGCLCIIERVALE